MLFSAYISLESVLYVSSGNGLAAAVLVRFCRVPRRLSFGRSTLLLFALAAGEDSRQQEPCDVLALVLRDLAVAGELFRLLRSTSEKVFCRSFSPRGGICAKHGLGTALPDMIPTGTE